MNILKAENISFGYIEKRPILKGLDFEMNNSEVVGLFGDSGSGKSTFCKILTRFIQDYYGKITINNNEIETIKNSSLPDICKESIIERLIKIDNHENY